MLTDETNSTRRQFSANLLGSLSGTLLVVPLGCGAKQEPRRVAVSGSVIVGDKLIPEATVRFLPAAGNSAPVAVTTVSGGLYHFTKLDGPYPGKYTASVNLELSSLSKMATDDPQAPAPPMQWEQEITVPDEDSATQHFLWKSADELKSEAKKSP